MKCKKGKLIILLIVIVSSLSGCFVSDEQKVFNGFDKYGMWNYFPSSFYDLLQDETKNVSYRINWEGEGESYCNPDAKQQTFVEVSRYVKFGLEVKYQTDETYCDGKINGDTEICDDGFCKVPVTITPDNKIEVQSEYIDQQYREMIENTPIVLSDITFDKDYVKNNLELKNSDSRYLYNALYNIKDYQNDINNINLKKKLNIDGDFYAIRTSYDEELKQCTVSFIATNGVAVWFTIGGNDE